MDNLTNNNLDNLNNTEFELDKNKLFEEIKSIVDDLKKKNLIKSELVPNIDLYVDQITSFIDDNSYTNLENHLTKSMVNNYTKNKVLPASNKKKYTKHHILLLIIIFNTKSILSISDIKKIFAAIIDDKNNINDNVLEFYDTLNSLVGQSNYKDIIFTIENLDIDYKSKRELVSIIATKLAVEANNNKILSEVLIEKYL